MIAKKIKTKQKESRMKDNENRQKNLDWLSIQPIEYQISLFQDYVEIMKIIANNLMQEDISKKCGEHYSHDKEEAGRYNRWGYNPGSIKIGSEKIPIDVPRYYDLDKRKTSNADVYGKIKEQESLTNEKMRSILLGLSQKDYGNIARTMAESFGLSQSTISRRFIEESSEELKKFEERDLGNYDFVALMIDGKYLAKEQAVIALGITITGEKLVLGFIQTTSENTEAVKGLLKNLLERNLKFTEGLLCVLDGSKGLRKAVKEVFANFCIIQRCQWHKRENVVSYLNEKDKLIYRARLQAAYSEPLYEEAKRKLIEILNDLFKVNRSAANSLQEGLEETLTIQRLGLTVELGKSLSTTNCIENLNSRIGTYLRKIKHWKSPEMLARWVTMSFLEIEPRLRRINNYQQLNLLRCALKTELKIEHTMVA